MSVTTSGAAFRGRKNWLDLAEEIIVVDSGSLDGSAELARVRFYTQMSVMKLFLRGLYAAWNDGIRLAGSDYCYLSTVGDSISREGWSILSVLHKE